MKKFNYITYPSNFIQIPVRISSTIIARGLAKTRVTPNQVTITRGLFNIGSLYCFAVGDWAHLIAAFFIFQIFEICDHVDGDLARLKNMRSNLGLYLEHLVDILESTVQGFLGLCVSIGIFRQTGDFSIFFIFITITMAAALSPKRQLSDYGHAQYGAYYSIASAESWYQKLFRLASVLFIWKNQLILWSALLYYPITEFLHFDPLYWSMLIIALLMVLNWFRQIVAEYRRTMECD